MTKTRIIISIALILITAFIAFLPSLNNAFTNWDDDYYVTENKAIRRLSWENTAKIFSSFFIGNYQPLTILSHSFEYHFFKLNPFGYHLTNLILHLGNCLLVFWLIFMLSRKVSVSLITAILFGIHPLHVESVAWISERKDVLYTFFFLGVIISYLYYLRLGRISRYYYLSISFFIFSLLSKPMAITLPLVLLLADYSLNRKPGKIMLIDKLPFFILSLIFGIIAILTQHLSGAVREEGLFNLLDKIMVASYGLIFYLNKIFMPVRLSCLYPKNTLFFLYSFIVAVALFIAVILSARYTRKLIFGSALFLVTILPVLQFIPIGETIVADRYVYFPSLGIFYLIAEGFVWLYRRIRYKLLLAIILIVTTGALALLTYKRCQVWQDSITLWTDALNNYPDAATAYNSRGAVFLATGQYDKAYSDFINTLRIDRNYYEAYLNLCGLYNSLGDYRKAIGMCNKTIEINPGYLKAYDLLAIIYGKIDNHREVINLCKKAIQMNPDHAQTYSNLCSAYGNVGDLSKAIASCQKALDLDYHLASAHNNLAVAYYYAKQYDLAIRHCDIAVKYGYKINPGFLKLLEPYRK